MNQVEALRAANVKAYTLNSNTPISERDYIYQDLATGHPLIRLLYVTPELCSGDHFRKRIQIVHEQKELARIAVDEAHCISEWGHDFRKDFKRLSWFRDSFPDVPIICLTATANTEKVECQSQHRSNACCGSRAPAGDSSSAYPNHADGQRWKLCKEPDATCPGGGQRTATASWSRTAHQSTTGRCRLG